MKNGKPQKGEIIRKEGILGIEYDGFFIPDASEVVALWNELQKEKAFNAAMADVIPDGTEIEIKDAPGICGGKFVIRRNDALVDNGGTIIKFDQEDRYLERQWFGVEIKTPHIDQ